MPDVDEELLGDAARLEAGDPGEMLRAVASSAAQVREAAALAREAGVERVAADPLPRAIVVLGMGGSGIAVDVLAALAGQESAVPIVVSKTYGLPRWVGAADLVVGVSCSGSTEETLSGVEEAVRRGCGLAAVAAEDSPLAELCLRGRGMLLPVRAAGRLPRAMVWGLSVPLALLARGLGLVELPDEEVEATAVRLERISAACNPDKDVFTNPGKSLALALAPSLPVAWGCSPVAGVAAQRFAAQWAENAKSPAVSGVLPEANHNQVVTFDGPAGALAGGSVDGIFADPDLGGPTGLRERLVLLRDAADEHPQVTRRAEVSKEIAEARGVRVTELAAEGTTRLERLASLVGVVDYASVYLGLGLGIDPTPIDAIQDLKARIAR